MLDIGGRVIFLTGAPLRSSLGWTEEELCAPLQPGFIERLPGSFSGISATDDKVPSWRSLPLEKLHLPTGLTQISRGEHQQFDEYGYSNDETSFLSAAELSFNSTEPHEYPSEHSQVSNSDKEGVFTQYYEHSFALHENIPSSQIVGAESLVDDSFTTDPEDSSITSSQPPHHPESHQLTRSKLTSSHLTDLKDLPNATHLHSITPQTMTVNLVLGILSIPHPRTIKTRKGGQLIDLVEILVGDDTKSGFGINIWLPSSHSTHHHQDDTSLLRTQTSHLRPQDVILAKTIALSSFRGKVYGQSLRRGMTTLDLLYRNVLDDDDVCGAFGAAELEQATAPTTTIINEPQIRKLRDVKEWVLRFVGGASLTGGPRAPLTNGIPSKSRGADEAKLQALPSDTPER